MIITEEMKKNFRKGIRKRVTIDGEKKEYETYHIPIEYLYYNDLNGRIASSIREYEDTHGKGELARILNENKDRYNDILAGLIKKSSNDNEKSFKRTKEDIRNKGQEEPGVILTDGRIIDGNRRFTAIRELHSQTGSPKFEYFEAAILPSPSENDKTGWKHIKQLEIYLQENKDEKRAYDRIDSLSSLYTTVMDPETRLLNETEYCYTKNIPDSALKKDMRIIDIMLDYLEWRGKPKAFYLLRNEKLDGPIEEVANKSVRLGDEWKANKDYIYDFITFSNSGDRSRIARDLLDSMRKGSVLFTAYKELMDTGDNPQKILDAREYKDKVTSGEETRIKKEKLRDIGTMITKNYDAAVVKDKTEKEKNNPFAMLDKIMSTLNDFKRHVKNHAIDEFVFDEEDKVSLIQPPEYDKYLDKLGEIKNFVEELEDKLSLNKSKDE